jgi:hypothetical protein
MESSSSESEEENVSKVKGQKVVHCPIVISSVLVKDPTKYPSY